MSNDLVDKLRRNSRTTSYRPGIDEMILEAADLIEAQAAQIEQMRGAILAIENDSDECLDFDECTAMLVPMDAYHRLVEFATTPDEALQAFAAKVRDQCAKLAKDYITTAGGLTYGLENAIRNLKELPK